MTRKVKFLGLAAAVMVLTLATQAAYANCQNEGPYELRQCAKSWFAPSPGGAVSTQWWALGFGNAGAFQSATNAAQDGSGFLPAPTPGVFIGNDSGSLDTAGLGLVNAQQFGGPAGSLCFGPIANWASPGVDGCGDVNRTDTGGGGNVSASNNYLNVYFGGLGPGTLYYSAQVDPPMGVLLKESGGTQFALAFFATKSRGKDPNDIAPGEYDLSALHGGGTSPTGDNVVTWQPIPEPNTVATLSIPADSSSPRNVTMTWTGVHMISDNTTRPCIQSDMVTPCASLGGASGVGTNDQGALVHYEMESTPLSGGTCGTTWTLVSGTTVDFPAVTTSATGIAPGTCLRLKTRFGRTPSQSMGPTLATNRLNAQTGTLGDIGYDVVSTSRKIGGATVSQNAVLTVAEKNKNVVTVKWETSSELSVTGFDVVGLDQKGNKKVVATVGCKACTSGVGASYTTLVPSNKLEGSKKLQVVTQPSGAASNTLDLK